MAHPFLYYPWCDGASLKNLGRWICFLSELDISILHFCLFLLYNISLINGQNSVIVKYRKRIFDLNTNIIIVINMVSVYTGAQDTSCVRLKLYAILLSGGRLVSKSSDRKNDRCRWYHLKPILGVGMTFMKMIWLEKPSQLFSPGWYDLHSWLCGSYYKQALFCWPCLLLSQSKSVWSTAFLFFIYR